jgi:hypothetical protein
MKKIFFLIMAVGLAFWMVGPVMSQAAGSTKPSATFTSVKGKVTVKGVKGKARKVKIGTKAFEGETVSVGKGGQTTFQLFDGSSLDLASNSQLVLKTLQQPSDKEKKIGFKLSFGAILAKVKKLLTPSSSFEIESGGAVCGVRGTEFAYSYDPDKNKINLQVHEGTVYFNFGGKSTLYHGGDKIEFINGHPAPGNTGGGGTNIQGTGGKSIPGAGGFQVAGGSLGYTGGTLGGWGGRLPGWNLNDQFVIGTAINHSNTLGNPSVTSARLNIVINVPIVETGLGVALPSLLTAR